MGTRSLLLSLAAIAVYCCARALGGLLRVPVPDAGTERKPEAAFDPPAPLMEALAADEHERWSHWHRYLVSRCVVNPDGSLTIPPGSVERWDRQARTPYAQLSDRERESDRMEVRKRLGILRQFGVSI